MNTEKSESAILYYSVQSSSPVLNRCGGYIRNVVQKIIIRQAPGTYMQKTLSSSVNMDGVLVR